MYVFHLTPKNPDQFPRYMMATKATWLSGSILHDISESEPTLCCISGETATDYIGTWVFGAGYLGVCFPKSSTRPITAEDITLLDGTVLMSGSSRFAILKP